MSSGDSFSDWVNGPNGPLSDEESYEEHISNLVWIAVKTAAGMVGKNSQGEFRKIKETDPDIARLMDRVLVALCTEPVASDLKKISDKELVSLTLLLFVCSMKIYNDPLWRDNHGYS